MLSNVIKISNLNVNAIKTVITVWYLHCIFPLLLKPQLWCNGQSSACLQWQIMDLIFVYDKPQTIKLIFATFMLCMHP